MSGYIVLHADYWKFEQLIMPKGSRKVSFSLETQCKFGLHTHRHTHTLYFQNALNVSRKEK